MKRRLLALFLILCALAVSGCGKQGLESQLLVIILGIDQSEKGVRLTVKAPSNASSESSSSSQSSESGGDQKGYLMLEATGRDFVEALSILNAATPRTLNFSQTREIVIGIKAAQQDDFVTLLESLATLPRIRDHAMIIIVNGEAYDFADSHKPYLGVRLSTYIETTLDNYEDKGFIPNTSLFEAHRDFAYGYIDPLLICGGVNQFKSDPSEIKEQPENLEAGKMPRKSVNAVEMLGAAATDGVRVSGILTGYEMALVNLVGGHVEALEVKLSDFYVTVTPRYAADLKVDLSGEKAVLRVKLTLDINQAPGRKIDTEELIALLEADLKKTIQKLQQFKCDGIGFGNIAVRQFFTIADWEKLDWRTTYAKADIDISITTHITER